jgi:hypothetical protein
MSLKPLNLPNLKFRLCHLWFRIFRWIPDSTLTVSCCVIQQGAPGSNISPWRLVHIKKWLFQERNLDAGVALSYEELIVFRLLCWTEIEIVCVCVCVCIKYLRRMLYYFKFNFKIMEFLINHLQYDIYIFF